MGSIVTTQPLAGGRRDKGLGRLIHDFRVGSAGYSLNTITFLMSACTKPFQQNQIACMYCTLNDSGNFWEIPSKSIAQSRRLQRKIELR